jgi:hypothetical protein
MRWDEQNKISLTYILKKIKSILFALYLHIFLKKLNQFYLLYIWSM